MTDETFELCKVIYEATGWEYGEYGFDSKMELLHYCTSNEEAPITVCPLYSSDILLDKLPPYDSEYRYLIMEKSSKNSYIFGYAEEGFITGLSGNGSTPLIALLKLCLELKKEHLI